MPPIRESREDGPPECPRGRSGPRWADHRTLRLCRQVQEALHQALAGESGDPLLQELWVASVDPGADPSRLEVTVVVPSERGAADVLARLEKTRGRLRSLVAQAISRKKVPDLVFRIAPPELPGREPPR